MVESSFTHTFISKPSMLKISHLSSRLPCLKEAEEGGPGTRLTYRAFKNAEAALSVTQRRERGSAFSSVHIPQVPRSWLMTSQSSNCARYLRRQP